VGTPGATGVSVDTVNKQLNLGSGGFGTTVVCGIRAWLIVMDRNASTGNAISTKVSVPISIFNIILHGKGEGFTFAIVSGHNIGTDIAPVYINDYTDCGGGLSEYMGLCRTRCFSPR